MTPTQMVDVGGAVRVEAIVPRAAAATATATLWWRVDFQVNSDAPLPEIHVHRPSVQMGSLTSNDAHA